LAGPFGTILGDEESVVRQPNDQALSQGSGRRILDRPASFLIDDLENRFQCSTGRLVKRPAGSRPALRGFIKVMQPVVSVVMTASPMLQSVTRSHSCVHAMFVDSGFPAYRPPSRRSDDNLAAKTTPRCHPSVRAKVLPAV
jgi:hypothetical protein